MYVGSYRSALYGPRNAKKSLPKFTIGDRSILEKRIHSNPKFTSVSSRTDSGFNARRKEELQREIHKYYKVGSNEVFARISLHDLMQLMIAHSQECQQYQECPPDAGEEAQGRQEVEQDVVSQMTAVKITASSGGDERLKEPQPPYLLVDVRPPTDHLSVRLLSSVNHQLTRLSRSVNWECQELLMYRNHPEWIIVIYDCHEDIVPEYASTLIHRGYENVFVLSGGLKLAKDKFGYPLVLDRCEIEKKAASGSCDNSKFAEVKEEDQSVCGGTLLGNANNEFTHGLELFKLGNKVLPDSVTEKLTEQLSSVILPPLSTKGACAEYWINSALVDGSDAASSGPGSCVSSVRTARGATGSVQSTNRTASKNAASRTAVRTSREDRSAGAAKPWR